MLDVLPPGQQEVAVEMVAASADLFSTLGVPVLPATEGPSSVADIHAFFADHRGAVMIKALAGGGGRGMRRVDSADQIDIAYRQCAGEDHRR